MVQESDKAARAQVHLPSAPEGWSYGIVLDGPGQQNIKIDPNGDGYTVTLTAADGAQQSTDEEDLRGALKASVDAAKHLNRLETQRKALEAEQAKAASIFGKPAAPAAKPKAAKPETTTPRSAAPSADEAGQPPLA